MSEQDLAQQAANELDAMMSGQSAGGDNLVAELQGADDGPNEAPASEEPQEEATVSPTESVLEQLRKANQAAGKAGYELGQTRKELAEKDEYIQALEARIQQVEVNQQASQQYEGASGGIERLPEDQLDGFMERVDSSWADKKDDPYYRYAADVATNIAMEAVRTLRGEIQGIAGGVQDMQFNQRLERLGIDRAKFDAIWQDPAYSWGQGLALDQRLAALESQARIPTGPPSHQAPAMQPSSQGAPPASRVDPRRTIETSQAPGSVQNPARLSTLALDRALAEGNDGDARAHATQLFDQWMRR